jgi:phosphoenolpyruvate synthase/pyruvate phosphate dikinase
MNLERIDRNHIVDVGGKGAHLGELMRVDGIRVPAGFCVTTEAFELAMAEVPSIADRLDQLSRRKPEDREAIHTRSAEIRQAIEDVAIPPDVASAIGEALGRFGLRGAFAVRSSATAEDLPGASFAGQHDSYLNIVGASAILHHVRRCWASLFSERAVMYRRRYGFDDRNVRMAVVVQQMVEPEVAGVLFTADPVTSNRELATVEATWGLGEALVSGLVGGDRYRVSHDAVLDAMIGQGTRPTLTEAQVIHLVHLGRRIEAHFGSPQDIEWCRVGDEFAFVQSRPITTLFPVPEKDDDGNHVYLSVGHQQMMTDPMKPLGLSFWQLTTRAGMAEAGGRLFVDITQRLASPTSRASLLELVGRSDPLTVDALRTILERDGFIRPLPDPAGPVAGGAGPVASGAGPVAGGAGPVAGGAAAPIETDPAIVTELIGRSEASIAALKHDIRTKSGPALLDFIREDIGELKRILFDPQSHQVFMSAMEATWWLNERLEAWLGEKNAADTLTQSVPHNVTSEMGLALLDVADAIRPHPDVVAFLQDVGDEPFLDGLAARAGGREARAAIEAWLDKYGMRCAGEIDITRPRWSEDPAALASTILGNIKNLEPGAGERRFEQGRQEAWQKEQDVLQRLRGLPEGERKAEETKRMIDRVRTFIGYREYPKYGMVSRYFVYKQALLAEADRLVLAGVLRDREDIFYLTFQELHDVVRTHCVDDELIARRKEEFTSYQALTPPRVLTSDGEAISGTYRRDDLPPGALAGLPVSAGTVEGRARVVTDMARADLKGGDILVTPYTDPSWTPLFLTAAGLVTEVGGLMTHGAVIAREYGLPAVVGVEQATRLIRDGQRIRVNGTAGHIELLD